MRLLCALQLTNKIQLMNVQYQLIVYILEHLFIERSYVFDATSNVQILLITHESSSQISMTLKESYLESYLGFSL